MAGPVPRNAISLGTLLALSLALTCGGAAGAGPTLWGYGVKSCRELVAAVPPSGADIAGSAEYPRYREWLAGLVSGLNLATGRDVLMGAELEAALTRIRAHCQERPEDDFFNASLTLIKTLGGTKGQGPE
ncbi:MAG: hypothetical protein ACM3ST_12780 [Bdellovibrio bacteriovorus]